MTSPPGRYVMHLLVRLALRGVEQLLVLALVIAIVAAVGKGLLSSHYSISEVLPQFSQVIGAISH